MKIKPRQVGGEVSSSKNNGQSSERKKVTLWRPPRESLEKPGVLFWVFFFRRGCLKSQDTSAVENNVFRKNLPRGKGTIYLSGLGYSRKSSSTGRKLFGW